MPLAALAAAGAGSNTATSPPALGEGAGRCSAGDARAEDRDALRRGVGAAQAMGVGRRGRFAGEHRLQPLALAAMAGHFPDFEASGGEAAAHMAGDGVGGEAGAWGRARGDQRVEGLGPHRLVLRRGEAVEKPGVGGEPGFRQGGGDVAYMEGERHAVFWPAQAAHAAGAVRPAGEEPGGQRR